jgi:phytoene dehydrogenase-like protein
MPHAYWKLIGLTLLACVCLGDHAHLDAFQEPAEPPAAPLEDSPLLFEPTTLDEHFDAVLTSVRLARPRLARQYLERMMAMNPSEADLLALRDKHGPAAFLNLANIEELRPLSADLLETVSDAFRRRALDPQRIDALISDLAGTPHCTDDYSGSSPHDLAAANDGSHQARARVFESRGRAVVARAGAADPFGSLRRTWLDAFGP